MNCLFCDKKISDRAKYCTEAHRKAYVRRTKVGQEPGQNDPDIATRTFDFELTRTDRLFEDFKPNYYNFSEKVFDKECLICSKKFKTRLQLAKTCSPAHFKEMMDFSGEKSGEKTVVDFGSGIAVDEVIKALQCKHDSDPARCKYAKFDKTRKQKWCPAQKS